MPSSSFYSAVATIKIAENLVIKELLDNPFSMRPLYDKLTIMKKRVAYYTIPQCINIKLRQKYIEDICASLSMIRLTG
jgi:hypothetical protein